MEERPKPPSEHIIMGSILYWMAIIACILCIIFPFMSVALPKSNHADPYKSWDVMWKGEGPAEVWKEITPEGKYPGATYWVRHFLKPDAMIMLGMWLGGICAGVGLFVGGLIYLSKRMLFYGIVALLMSTLVWLVCFNVIKIG